RGRSGRAAPGRGGAHGVPARLPPAPCGADGVGQGPELAPRAGARGDRGRVDGAVVQGMGGVEEGRVRAAVVVAAGGTGRRMGGVRKQYAELLGEPILLHSIRPFLAHSSIVSAVVALPPDDAADPPSWLTGLDERVTVVAGGAERGESVHRGLQAVPDSVDV